jgi:hypothetical protein
MFAGCLIIGDLDLKRVPSGRGDDLKRIKRAPLRWDASASGEEDGESDRCPDPNSDRPHRRSSVARSPSEALKAGFKSKRKSASSAQAAEGAFQIGAKRRQCGAKIFEPSSGLTSAAINPFGPGPNRASMLSPGFGSTKP